MKLFWYAVARDDKTVGVKEVSRELLEAMFECKMPIQYMFVVYDSMEIYNLKVELSQTRVSLHKVKDNIKKLKLASEIDELDQFCDYCSQRGLNIKPDCPEEKQ